MVATCYLLAHALKLVYDDRKIMVVLFSSVNTNCMLLGYINALKTKQYCDNSGVTSSYSATNLAVKLTASPVDSFFY